MRASHVNHPRGGHPGGPRHRTGRGHGVERGGGVVGTPSPALPRRAVTLRRTRVDAGAVVFFLAAVAGVVLLVADAVAGWLARVLA